MPGADNTDRPRRRRVPRRVAWVCAVLAVVALLPVPWRLQLGDDPLALAWHLDGRLEVDGELLDPPGTWSWLTVGRPPLVGEVVVDVLDGGDMSSWDIRDGDPTSRPAMVEPMAAAVGLREAGIDVAPAEVDAVLFGNLPDLAPIDWARRHLALGPSHGLMVGLTTWAAARDVALEGVHVAGTGGLQPDGAVTPIGGLAAKARAARDDGADVLFFPRTQASDLDGFAAGAMRLVGVDHITEAIATLEHLAEPDRH